MNSSTLSSLLINNQASATLLAKDSTITTLNNNWGSLRATLDNSNVGNITYGVASFADINGNASNGLTFQNKSKLNGSITNNISQGNSAAPTFTFDDSSMVGNINNQKSNNVRANNNLSIHFKNNASLKGDIQAKAYTTNVDFTNSTFEGSISTDSNNGVLKASFDDSKLTIGSIINNNTSSSLSFNHIAEGSSIGDINFRGDIQAKDLNISLANIQNSKTTSKIIFAGMQGKSIGNISGDSTTDNFGGSLEGTLDFNPTTDGSTLKVGNLFANRLDLNFDFGGTDKSKTDGSVIGKQTTPVVIKGGDASSNLSFDAIGTLNLTPTPSTSGLPASNHVFEAIESNTGIGIDDAYTGGLSFSHTNITLANGADSVSDTQPVFSKSNATNSTGILPQDSNITSLNATFGNATLAKDASGNLIYDKSGNAKINANNPTNTNDPTSFYTLTYKDKTHTDGDGFVSGKSSDVDIGYKDDGLKKDISFVFTPNTFTGNQSGYTGNITGGTSDSKYSFYNAGSLNVTQVYSAIGSLSLVGTSLNGLIGQSTSYGSSDVSNPETHPLVSLSLDYSGNDIPAYGLAIVGQGKHNITFDFTGNTQAIKFAGSLLGGDEANPSENFYGFLNLDGIQANASSITPNTSPSPSDASSSDTDEHSLSYAMSQAGFLGFNNLSPKQSASSTQNINGFDDLKSSQSNDFKNITKGSTISLIGSSITGNLQEKEMALDLHFSTNSAYNTQLGSNNHFASAPNDSYYAGDAIDLSSNPYDQSLTFIGEGSMNPLLGSSAKPIEGSIDAQGSAWKADSSKALNLYLGTGKNNLIFIDTNSTLSLHLKATKDADNKITYTAPKEGSKLTIHGTSLIGDFTGNIQAKFGKTLLRDQDGNLITGSDNNPMSISSKFYGQLSNTTTTKMDITLNEGALFDPTNITSADYAKISSNYDGFLSTQGRGDTPITFSVPTLVFNSTTASNNVLHLNNPGGILQIKGLQKASGSKPLIQLADGSSLISNNTSLIGDIITNDVSNQVSDPVASKNIGTYYNLSFQSTTDSNTPDSFYAGSYIGYGSNNTYKPDGYSKLSFSGRGSLKSIVDTSSMDASAISSLKSTHPEIMIVDTSTYLINAKDSSNGKNASASDVNLIIGLHNMNSSVVPSGQLALEMKNTGGGISFQTYQQAGVTTRAELPYFYSLNTSGVSWIQDKFYGSVYYSTTQQDPSNTPVFKMTFANGDNLSTNVANTSKTDGSTYNLNDANLGKDYIEQSSYGVKDFENGSSDVNNALTFTFIGKDSHNFTSDTTASNKASVFYTANANSKMNFINASGTSTQSNEALNLSAFSGTPTGTINTSSGIKNLTLSGASGTISLLGTSLGGSNDLSATKLNLNAVFNNNTSSSDSLYAYNLDGSVATTDAFGALSDPILKVQSSALLHDATLSFGANNTVNLSFIGKDALQKGATINASNANVASTFSFSHTNLSFDNSINLTGKTTLDAIEGSGKFSGLGSKTTISTQGLKASTTTPSASINNVLAFKSYGSTQTTNLYDLSDVGGLDYTGISDGGSFAAGSLASTSAFTYTFIGKDSNAFSQTNSPDTSKATTLDSNLANATINVIDGGILNTDNLKDVSGTDNQLNLYGQSALSLSDTSGSSKELALKSNLSITATIDNANASLWGGTTDSEGNTSVDFNISNPTNPSSPYDIDNTSAIYHLTFKGDYSNPDSMHQFYKGTLGGLNTESSIVFENAGYLKETQIQKTHAKVIYDQTLLMGNLNTDLTTLDFRPSNNPNAGQNPQKGLFALTGNIVTKNDSEPHIKNITFDFTGNTQEDKIKNDASEDKNYFIAGDSGSSFSFINLTDNKSQKAKRTPTKDASGYIENSSLPNHSILWDNDKKASDGTTSLDGVFASLQDVGVHLRAAGGSDSYDGKAQSLSPDSTFNFYGSSIQAGDDKSIESAYGLGFVFDGRSTQQIAADPIILSDLKSGLEYSYLTNTDSITAGNSLSLSFNGMGSFIPTRDSSGYLDRTLNLKLNDGGLLNISVGKLGDGVSDDELFADFVLDSSITSLKAGSSLNLSHSGFKGNFITSKDASGKGGDIIAQFNDTYALGKSSVLGTKDGLLDVSIDHKVNAGDTTLPSNSAPIDHTFIIGNGVSKLDLNNAGLIKINSTQKTIVDTLSADAGRAYLQTTWDQKQGTTFGNGSDLYVRGTSIVGSLWTSNLQTKAAQSPQRGTHYDLSFSVNPQSSPLFVDEDTNPDNIIPPSVPDSFYAGFYIGYGANNTYQKDGYSKLSFSGRGSLKTIVDTSSYGASNLSSFKSSYPEALKIDDSTYLINARDSSNGKNASASYVNLIIGLHNMNTSLQPSGQLALEMKNTGGGISFQTYQQAGVSNLRADMTYLYSMNTSGVSWIQDKFYGSVYYSTTQQDPSNTPVFKMTFANGDNLSTNVANTSKTDGSTYNLNDANLGKDYIEQSSYGVKDFENGSSDVNNALTFTFIGKDSHNFTSDTTASNKASVFYTANANSKMNFINASGTSTQSNEALNLSAFSGTPTGTTDNAGKTLINPNTASGTINLLGTSLGGSNDLSATKLNLNAVFDQRGIDTDDYAFAFTSPDASSSPDTDSSDTSTPPPTPSFNALTTDAFGALGDPILKVQKSTLNTTLALGDNNTVSLTFYGKDALGSGAKITGGTSGSYVLIDGSGSYAKDTTSASSSSDTSTSTPDITLGNPDSLNIAGQAYAQQFGSFDFNTTKGFKGNVIVFNTPLSSNLEDQAGLSYKDGVLTPAKNADGTDGSYTDADQSKNASVQITFNQGGLSYYKEPTQDTDTPSSPEGSNPSTPETEPSLPGMSTPLVGGVLSQEATQFIQSKVNSYYKDYQGGKLSVDLNHQTQMNKSVGYTQSALTLNFIGKDSIVSANTENTIVGSDEKTYTTNTASGFYIHDDNEGNQYNFIDFGAIDLSLMTYNGNGILNGTINWIGNTYQIGLVTNGLGHANSLMPIDFSKVYQTKADGTLLDVEYSKVGKNTYKAQQNAQFINFDFGGDAHRADKTTTDNASDYKMRGSIIDAAKTDGSLYVFSKLGTLDTSTSSKDTTTGVITTTTRDFIDTLNEKINPINFSDSTKQVIQLTKGGIGLRGTSVDGDIFTQKVVDTTPGATPTDTPTTNTIKNITLSVDFDKDAKFNGSDIGGTGDKKISFEGSDSFDKNKLNITGGQNTSVYTFKDTGVWDQSQLDKLLNTADSTQESVSVSDLASSYPSSSTTSLTGGDATSPAPAASDSSSGTLTPPTSSPSDDTHYKRGTFDFEGSSVLIGNLVDSKDASLKDKSKADVQSIAIGVNSTDGTVLRGVGDKFSLINTTANINAKFGVGSKVDIQNKNSNSVYDFSAFGANKAPVIAVINLNTQDKIKDSTSSDGILKATISGFDGTTALLGSIQDSTQTLYDSQADYDIDHPSTEPLALAKDSGSEDAGGSSTGSTDTPLEANKTEVVSNNTYTFGTYDYSYPQKASAAQWVMTADSSVDHLVSYNAGLMGQNNALNSTALQQGVSVIDLRGARAFEDSALNPMAKAALSAAAMDASAAANQPSLSPSSSSSAVLNGASSADIPTNTNAFNTLKVKKLTMGFGVVRVGVDTDNSVGDKILIDSVDPSSGNILQVYLDKGSAQVNNPILLASIQSESGGEMRNNYFTAAASVKGLYVYTPALEVKRDMTKTVKASDGTTSTEGISITTSDNINDNTTTKNINIQAKANGDDASYTTNSLSYYLTGFDLSADTTQTQPVQSALGSFYRGFRIATNNLNLRMGELRGGINTQGAWARIINGMGSDKSNNTDYYTTIQAGYDYAFDVLGGVDYVGVDAEATLLSSKGDGYKGSGRNLGLGIYNTYLMDNGFYVDSSLKYLNLGNSLTLAKSNLQNSGSNIYTNAILLGAEVGYRYHLDNLMHNVFKAPENIYTQGYFIEPQLELIYGYIGGTQINAKAIDGTPFDANLEGDNAFISRLGAVLGKSFKTNTGLIADVRLGLSYINEINTGGSSQIIQTGSATNPAIINSTPSNNKLNLSLGTNIKFNDSWRMYADISRTFLGVYNFDYNLNIGARFSFGAKENAQERAIKAKEEQNKKDKANQEKEQNKAQTLNDLLKNKQVITANEFKNTKVGCQGCAPEKGLYLQVAVMTQQDSSSIMKLFEKYPYRVIPFAYKDKKGNTMQAKRYLLGPLKNMQDVYEHKNQADKIVQAIDKDAEAYSVLYEVK
ncbi:hypothetical protein [Helicobacter sp. 13S00477-4]|uniref:hypothetical protein n=1 Tax=Helicobacter sp. 13S00477-4 TaxID=1905759 RepID=UPI00117A964C|nr:hypothetical protein [Helicobacter sp. 13S00477-4]